jgi:hypothetical protein
MKNKNLTNKKYIIDLILKDSETLETVASNATYYEYSYEQITGIPPLTTNDVTFSTTPETEHLVKDVTACIKVLSSALKYLKKCELKIEIDISKNNL